MRHQQNMDADQMPARPQRLGVLLAVLRDEGCQVLDKADDSDYGKFGWVIDPEGNKVELWQPPPGQ
jgi:predicted enzyme related to lactoylglutathione lyase